MYVVCVERSLYWLAWISATVYALYQFAKVGQSANHSYRLNALEFKDGTLSANLYDATDFEWQSFKKLYINYWYIVAIHFILSNVFTLTKQPALKLASWIFITLYATYTVFSVGALVVVIINVIILVMLAVLGKNILSYALCFGVILASQSTEIANRIFNSQDPRMTNEFDFEEKRFLFTYCICFLNARGLSSSLDNLTVRQKKELQAGKEQFVEKTTTIAAYLLYLPGFFAGPIYMYNDFEQATRHVKAEPDKALFMGPNYTKSMSALFILIANVLYYEWLLHWLYSSAISNDFTLVSSYESWQFSGYIVSLCLLFYMKYTCIYGTFKVLATFDGVASISPPLPQCVGAMHLNSQLWRKFDVGIYNWLRKYIYDPITKPGNTTLRRFAATLVCFGFIALWHLPLTSTLTMWIGLNVISALLEIWARAFGQTSVWDRVKQSLSRPSYLRLLAIISLPLFALAIFSNLFFLSNSEQVANEFAKRILNNSNNYAYYIMLLLYCGANVSLDYNKVVKSTVDFAESHGFPCLRKEQASTSEKGGPKTTQSKKTK